MTPIEINIWLDAVIIAINKDTELAKTMVITLQDWIENEK